MYRPDGATSRFGRDVSLSYAIPMLITHSLVVAGDKVNKLLDTG